MSSRKPLSFLKQVIWQVAKLNWLFLFITSTEFGKNDNPIQFEQCAAIWQLEKQHMFGLHSDCFETQSHVWFKNIILGEMARSVVCFS